MHSCPAPGCQRDDIPDEMFMCSQDWYKVRKPLRTAIWRAYRNGAGVGTPQLRTAHQAAIRSLEREA